MTTNHQAQSHDETPTSNFLNFFHTIKDLLFILDMDGNILKVNQAVTNRLGYTQDQLIGKSVLLVHPEHRKEEALQNVEEMLRNEREYCPIPLITKDGLEIPVETRVTFGEWDDKQVLFGVCKDISELKLSEEKFYKIFQNSNSLIAITNKNDGRYIDVNQTFCDVLGYKREEVIGATSKELNLFKHYEDRIKVLDELEARNKVRNAEVEILGKNNESHIGLFNADSIYVGSEPCLVTTMVDVTELKKLEQDIKKYNAELQTMVEAEIEKKHLINKELENQVYLTETLFNQPAAGIFYMMLDEPITWNDSIDKDKTMEYVFDHHRITKVNQAMLDQYGSKPDDFLGATPNILFAHDLEQGKRVWKKFFDEGHLHTETQEQRFDGSSMNVLGDYICMYDDEGRILGHFGIQLDITNQKLAEQAAQKYREELTESEERYRMIAESTSDIIWVYNITALKFTFFSPNIQRLLGYTVEEALGLSLDEILTPEHARIFREEMKSKYLDFMTSPDRKNDYLREALQVRKDGTYVWTEISSNFKYNKRQEVEIIGVIRNIDDKKRKEEELQYHMIHDPLTGLMNRNALILAGEQTGRPSSGKAPRSVMIINIDKFRIVNETMGHFAGDHLLKQFAEKITETIGEEGTVYRSAGDEFLVILNATGFDLVDRIARRTLKAISRQISINKWILFLSASIGVAIGNQESKFQNLLRNADTALYVARKQSNTVVYYTPEMDNARTREQILTEDLQHALAKGELELWFQPIYDIRKCRFNQAEALLRWMHPTFGSVSPDEFIPIAEKTKLIIPITDWIINEACGKLARWQERGIQELTISVNLSLVSFENKGFELVEQITEAISAAGINPSAFKIEITERVMLNSIEDVRSVFQQLKKIGVRLALDDFGIGYSSFSHLRDIPFDIVKIDRSLLESIAKDHRDQMILDSLVSIIHGLGMQAVAEGVETIEQFDQVVHRNCDFIQGFLLAKPMASDDFEDFYLKQNRDCNHPVMADSVNISFS